MRNILEKKGRLTRLVSRAKIAAYRVRIAFFFSNTVEIVTKNSPSTIIRYISSNYIVFDYLDLTRPRAELSRERSRDIRK